MKILDQWRKKAALHSANAVFIETGFDFSYVYKESLEVIYDNYKVFYVLSLYFNCFRF